MAKKPLPTPEQLRQLLRYDPETGRLFWKCRPDDNPNTLRRIVRNWNARFAGKEAFTSTRSDGYKVGMVGNRTFRAHRVIWAMVHSEWPEGEIDHIDCDRANNRIDNLRAASRTQNAHNYAGRGSSKYRGVCWDQQNKKWACQIAIAGKQTRIGRFQSEIEAALAYDRAATEHFKDYAKLNFPPLN